MYNGYVAMKKNVGNKKLKILLSANKIANQPNAEKKNR